jgi:proteasome alpha subunit
LANAYAQTLGTVFTTESKPLEVEIVVAEVGDSRQQDQVYRLTYDGSVADQTGFVVMGGAADQVAEAIGDQWSPGMPLGAVLSIAVRALSGPDGALGPESLEVAVLDRSRPRRAFRRIDGAALSQLLGRAELPDDAHGESGPPSAAAGDEEDAPDQGPAPDQPDASAGGGSGTPDGHGHSGLPGDRP